MAPLRRVDVGAARVDEPGLAAPVRYTPTFVLMDRGREVGRITGYIGDDAFWGLLGKLLAEGRTGLLPTDAAMTTE
jgi:thioredoxin-related protein